MKRRVIYVIEHRTAGVRKGVWTPWVPWLTYRDRSKAREALSENKRAHAECCRHGTFRLVEYTPKEREGDR